ncbi:MAG TPA: hypothetical protein VLA45_10550 [Paracoccaceae bacterium]|nr:hypothetical protein [Paracoccaceae bacterium]
MRPLALILALCSAAPLAAQSTMSGAEFDAYSRGKTFYYGSQGQPYGAEDYLDDKRVRWSFLDGKCKDGYWYEVAGQICFVYEDNPEPQCWSFTRGPNGLIARFENREDQSELYEVEQSETPMLCLGPDVGA